MKVTIDAVALRTLIVWLDRYAVKYKHPALWPALEHTEKELAAMEERTNYPPWQIAAKIEVFRLDRIPPMNQDCWTWKMVTADGVEICRMGRRGTEGLTKYGAEVDAQMFADMQAASPEVIKES